MGASTRWTLVLGVLLLGHAWSSPLPRPAPSYDSRLSPLELAIIKCIVETVPGVTKGGGGSYDWSVVRSRSKQLEGAEIEVVQVGQREPDFTGRSGGGEYPDDWNIVRSVSSQLAAREGGPAESRTDGSEGLSDDWGIVRSISTELHLDVEEAPGEPSVDPVYRPPVVQAGRGNFQGSDEVVFPISSGEDTSGGFGNLPIDVRSMPIDLRSGNVVVEIERGQTRAGNNFDSEKNEHQQSFGNGGTTQQVSGEQNNGGGTIGWSIVRSISSEQEPISEVVSSSYGNQQSISSSEIEQVKGDSDSYNLVQPISTELQPADNEAGEIPASLTEMFPPAVDQTGGAWNSPPLNGVQPAEVSEVHSSETDQSSPLEVQEPCEAGHKRIKNVCKKVYTFQLKSHLR